jgi:hypothetical protein
LSFAIRFIDVSTTRAGAAGVPWVNFDHRDAKHLRLVLDKGPELKERPAMQLCSLGLASLYPATDALEVFKGNPRLPSRRGAFSLLHNAFADFVVNMGGKAPFFAGKFLQAATRGLRAFGLKLLAQATVTKAHLVDALRGMDAAFAIDGNVDYAEVNAEKVVNVAGFWRVKFAGGKQIELVTNQAQVGFTPLTLQQFYLALTGNEWDALTAIHRPDADFPLVYVPTQDTRIVGNAAMPVKRPLCLAVNLVGLRNFGNAAYNHLCGQAGGFADGAINQFVNTELVERAGIPGDGAYFITDIVGLLKRLQQDGLLFWRGLQLHFGRQFHAYIVAIMFCGARLALAKAVAAVGARTPPQCKNTDAAD